MFNSRQIPINLQTVARLFRSPEPIGNHRNAATLRKSNFKDLTHTIKCPRIFVIDALHPSPEYGRVRDHRDLHSGKIQIESKPLRAITFWSAVETQNFLADEVEL